MPAASETVIRFEGAGSLPGESLIVAIFNYASVVRSTMSQENRDRFDAVNVGVLEDCRRFWLKIGALG